MKHTIALGSTSGDGLPGVWSATDGVALYDKVQQLTTGGGVTVVRLQTRRVGRVTWARNRIALVNDSQVTAITIVRRLRDREASATTTRTDDAGLRETIQQAEETTSLLEAKEPYRPDEMPPRPMLAPVLWSEQTAHASVEARTALAALLIAPTEAAGLLSAGVLQTTADAHMTITREGVRHCYPVTTAECSMTVRNVQGTASGWAGVNHTDLAKIDAPALAARALDKCQQSANPRAVEPGRYTAILEPQAVADLLAPLIGGLPGRPQADLMDRASPELYGGGPFAKRGGGWRIGEYVMDRRLTLRSDPMEPDGGFLPYVEEDGTPYRAVNWIDRGILKELGYGYPYALGWLHRRDALPCPSSYHLGAAPGVATESVADMIAKTTRGLLVTRLHGVECLNDKSVMCTGYTRDGVWLIEQGRITHPIKNFRFRTSPLYVLNNVLAIGASERVYAPEKAWFAPAIQAQDVNMVGLADAV